MCNEILEEYEWFVKNEGSGGNQYRTDIYNRACYLTVALQIRKLSSSKKR